MKKVKYYVQRRTALPGWETIAYPSEDNLEECFNLCVNEENKKLHKRELRLVKIRTDVIGKWNPND